MKIEVIYAKPEQQTLIILDVAQSTTAREAAIASGLDVYFPELDLARVPLGVFGEKVANDYQLAAGDRLELYRALLLDPMEARRQRAAQTRGKA